MRASGLTLESVNPKSAMSCCTNRKGMPSGKQHDRITLWLLPVVLAGAFMATVDVPRTVIVSIAFLIGGFMMGPDLDIYSVQYQRWGPMRWIWYPYQVMIKHRSTWSHGPLVGTLVRVFYLGAWIVLFASLGVLVSNHFWQTQLTWDRLEPTLSTLLIRYSKEWLALLIGLELGALSHYTSDWITSALKQKRPKKRPKRQKRRQRK